MKKSEVSKKNVLKALKKGERAAFTNIFNCYQRELYFFVFSITKSKYSTEEIIQDVFIKVWDNRKNINLSKSFDSYIFTIARNLTYNHLRSVSNRESLKQELWHNISLTSKKMEDDIIFSEYTDIVNEILLTLPKQKQSIYALSREEGKSNQEIADLLGISQKTVKNHLWKTLQVIKEQLKPMLKGLIIYFYFLFQ